MRYFYFLLLLLIPFTLFADVDTFEGQTGTDTWEGVSTTDTREGQAVASGGACAGGIDGDIGTPSDSGSVGGDYDLVYSAFTPTEDGDVTYMHCAIGSNDGGTLRMGIWSSTGTLLGRTGTLTGGDADETLHSALESAVCLVTGTTYLLGVCADDVDTYWLVLRGVYNAAFEIREFTSMSTALSDFNTSSSTQIYSGRKQAITANNSADTL